jgi:hypothetical protein
VADSSTIVNQLFADYRVEGLTMPYTIANPPARSMATILEVQTMNRKRVLASVLITTTLLFLSGFWYLDHAVTAAAQPKAGTGDDKDSVPGQVKELQKQVAELRVQVGELQKHRIIASGTATWTRPKNQANRTNTRVKLPDKVTAKLGEDYIVLLSNRFPKGGYPFFAAYWKVAPDGFDITLVDPPLGDGESADYTTNPNKDYLVDWIVVTR